MFWYIFYTFYVFESSDFYDTLRTIYLFTRQMDEVSDTTKSRTCSLTFSPIIQFFSWGVSKAVQP